MSIESLRVATSNLKPQILAFQNYRFNLKGTAEKRTAEVGDELNTRTLEIFQAISSQKPNLGEQSSLRAIFDNKAEYIQLDNDELLTLAQISQIKLDMLLSDLMLEVDDSKIKTIFQSIFIVNAISLATLDMLVDEQQKGINKPALKELFGQARSYYRAAFEEGKKAFEEGKKALESGKPNQDRVDNALNIFKSGMVKYMDSLTLTISATGGTGSTLTVDFPKLFKVDYSKFTPEELYAQSSVYLSNALRISTGVQGKPVSTLKVAAPIVASYNYAAQYLIYLAATRFTV